MIKARAELKISRVPLHKMEVREYQERYPDRLIHYIKLLEQHPEDDPGLISLKPLGGDRYEILDGHHRFCSLVMMGRPDALCVIIDEGHC